MILKKTKTKNFNKFLKKKIQLKEAKCKDVQSLSSTAYIFALLSSKHSIACRFPFLEARCKGVSLSTVKDL